MDKCPKCKVGELHLHSGCLVCDNRPACNFRGSRERVTAMRVGLVVAALVVATSTVTAAE